MPNVFIDPFILSCPPADAPLEEFESFVNNIIDIGELLGTSWISLYVPSSAVDVLAQTGSFPMWADLKAAYGKLKQISAQPQDIINIVNRTLNKRSNISCKFGIKDILVANPESRPCYHLVGRHHAFVQIYYDLLLSIYVITMLNNLKTENQVVMTSGLEADGIWIDVTGEIIDIDMEDGLVIELPLPVCTKFLSCLSVSGLLISIDPLIVLHGGECDRTFGSCLEIYVSQRVRYSDEQVLIRRSWSFGRHFLSSLRESGFITNSGRLNSLLKACADTILNGNMSATHWLRTSIAGNSPQKKRGDDGAWRRDIDYDYHLHYWETPSGPEFASICLHDDLTIPE